MRRWQHNMGVEQPLQLPTSWQASPLGEIALKITKGSTPTTYGYEFQKGGVNFIKIENVNHGHIDLSSISDFISLDAHENQQRSMLRAYDMLFSIAGTIGEIAIVEEGHLPANTNQAFAIISDYSNILLPKFLYYQLRSFVTVATKGRARGGAMNNVSLGDLKELNTYVAPINEQHRIVAKIEELFSELDKGIESLKTAREQLKIYRQAVLKHAFEGKLTAQWREENKTKLKSTGQLLARIQKERKARYQQQLEEWNIAVKEWEENDKTGKKPSRLRKPTSIHVEDITRPDLPNEWCWEYIGNLNADVFDGPFGSNLKTSDYVDKGVRVIRLENIGYLEFIEKKHSYITEEKYESIKKHTVSSGDIIFSSFIINGIRIAVLPESIKRAINKADCFCLRLHGDTVRNDFVENFLSTRSAYKQVESEIHGIGRPRINTTQLKSFAIPICSREEQNEIMNQLSEKLSLADNITTIIEQEIMKCVVLRQSILKKAFSGQLVEQDPNDEPASVLLERIRAEKAAQAKDRKPIRKPKPRRNEAI